MAGRKIAFPHLSQIKDEPTKESLRLIWNQLMTVRDELDTEEEALRSFDGVESNIKKIFLTQARHEKIVRTGRVGFQEGGQVGGNVNPTGPLPAPGWTGPPPSGGDGNAPNPAPPSTGGLQAPGGLGVVQGCSTSNPTEFTEAHQNYPTPPGPSRDAAEAFMRIVVPKLNAALGGDFYLNVKQNQTNGRISQDATAYWRTGMPQKEVYDIISRAGSPQAAPAWNFVGYGPAGDIE